MYGQIITHGHPAFPDGAPADASFLMVLERLTEAPELSKSQSTYAIVPPSQFQQVVPGPWQEPIKWKGSPIRVTLQAYIPNPDAPPKQPTGRDAQRIQQVRADNTAMPQRDKFVRVETDVLDPSGNIMFQKGSTVPSVELARWLEMGLCKMAPTQATEQERRTLTERELAAMKEQAAVIRENNAKAMAAKPDDTLPKKK